jgi:hypothetical protein
VGIAFGIPLGVHLLNGRKGSYWSAATASGMMMLFGVGALSTVRHHAAARAIAIGVPLLQIGASIAIERTTAE